MSVCPPCDSLLCECESMIVITWFHGDGDGQNLTPTHFDLLFKHFISHRASYEGPGSDFLVKTTYTLSLVWPQFIPSPVATRFSHCLVWTCTIEYFSRECNANLSFSRTIWIPSFPCIHLASNRWGWQAKWTRGFHVCSDQEFGTIVVESLHVRIESMAN